MALHILQWNARGLRTNKDQLKNLIINIDRPPDVVCVQETFLKTKFQSPKLDGYNIIQEDCTTHNKGGMIIYIKVGLNFTVLNIEQIEDIEIQGVEIKTSIGYLKIFNTYLSPLNTLSKENLKKIFTDKRSIIVGDLNAHNSMWGCSHTNSRGAIIEDLLIETNMVVLNTGQATHITPNNSTINSVIDLSICTQDMALNSRHIVTNNSLGSDHFASITVINEEVTIENNLTMQLWRLKKADWKEYKENSNTALTDEILKKENIDDKYNNLVECITELANQTIPLKNKPNLKNSKNKNKKFKPLPYWNEKCNEAIYKRNQSRNKMNKTKELLDYLNYKKQEAVVKHTLKTEAKSSWEDYCNKLTGQTKLGSVWNWARKMNGVASFESIPTLSSNGIKAETNAE